MSERIGPKQRLILEAMKDNGWLLNNFGRWSLYRGPVWWRYENQERCMGLYMRGFIMSSGEHGGDTRYVLTEKGKRA